MGSRSGNSGKDSSPPLGFPGGQVVEKRGYVYVGMVIAGMLGIVAFVIWKVR